MTGIFEPASAHHNFSKNTTQIKKVYNSIFEPQRQRYLQETPLAVTVGAERVKAFDDLAAP